MSVIWARAARHGLLLSKLGQTNYIYFLLADAQTHDSGHIAWGRERTQTLHSGLKLELAIKGPFDIVTLFLFSKLVF